MLCILLFFVGWEWGLADCFSFSLLLAVCRLFGSDSESEEEEVARKPAKRAASPPAKRAKASKVKSNARPKEEARRQRRDSGTNANV